MEEIADSSADFATAFEASFARFQICVEEACGAQMDWVSGVAAAIERTLEFAATNAMAANVLTNEALAAGHEGIFRYRRLLAYVVDLLAPGRQQRPEGDGLPETTEQMVAGGIAGLIAERLARGRSDELPAMAPEAIQFALTPYVGAEEARRIAIANRSPGS